MREPDPHCPACWGTGFFRGIGAPCDCWEPSPPKTQDAPLAEILADIDDYFDANRRLQDDLGPKPLFINNDHEDDQS